MRRVNINPNNVHAALEEIARASAENDPMETAQNFTTDTSFTETFELITSVPTLANTNLVLASLLELLKRGGLNRTT